MAAQERLVFDVEWTDPKSGVLWPLQLVHSPRDETVELFDTRAQRVFLKRTHYPQVRLEHLFPGGVVVVLARTLRILSAADATTKKRLDSTREAVFILVANHALQYVGAVLHRAQSVAGLTLVNAKLVNLSPADASRLSRDVDADDGPCLGFELFSSAAGGAAELLRKALEPATFGYYACGPAASADAAFFFNVLPPASCVARGTALAVVKPHVVLARQAGQVLDALVKEFRITGCTVAKLDRAQAASFLTVYDGVVTEYPHLVEELTSGPALAVECAPREDGDSRESVVQQLRDLAGPADPELARLLRPQALRATFGIDKVRNGIHVTDLESDGELEAATMFKLAQHGGGVR